MPERIELGLLRCGRHPLVDRLPRTLEGAVDGGLGGVEDAGGLGRGEAQDLAEDQHRSLRPGQMLECRDEGQFHALPPQVPRRRVGVTGHTGRFVVRQRLEPHRPGHRLPEVVRVPPRRSVVG